MGSRSRSIRLRIYFLVAIPLIAMAGLLTYAVGTSVNNAINLDRVPNLINASGIPAAKFGSYVQAERVAAVVYLFKPTAANLQAYQAAVSATDKATPAFTTAMTSPAVLGIESPSGASQIQQIIGGLKQLPTLRAAVQARAISPLTALGAYGQGMADTIKLFLIQTKSVAPTDQLAPAIGLIATVQAKEYLSQEDALLAGMLASRRMTVADRAAFTDLATARQGQLQYVDNLLDPPALAAWNAAQVGSGAMQQNLTGIEQAIAAGTPLSKLPVTAAQWQQIVGPLTTDNFNGGVAVSQEIVTADHRITHSAWVRVAAVCGGGLLGLLLTIVVTTLVARGIIRRLRGLERSALTVAQHQLPDVIGRLRRGEDVDVAHEAAPLQASPGKTSSGKVSHGKIDGDEIDRVGQSFDLVRQTAIRAAVEEARLRRGLNDVYRSLARRSQSLLHRQLALLDQMERRATDPEALDDLFRLDHLTTRMRRHAEGLIILAGAPPGRSWSNPVRMIDVMRGAIAEVEDYARVAVAIRSQAGLSGSAVADVIHLLAELIENATTLSPPYTSVRVSGDIVASGFAIEIEDRGLGMGPERMAELNARLAEPPEFNPADSEQLGLFVVSQLAKRHGIRVTLKASPYGGTAAIVLIPRQLVVAEDAFRPALAVEPAAITMAPLVTNGNDGAAAELTSASAFSEFRGPPGLAPVPGIRISGPLRGAQGLAFQSPAPQPVLEPEAVPGTGPKAGAQPFDVFAPLRRSQDSAPYPAPDPASAPYPGSRAAPGVPGVLGAPATPMTPGASAPPGEDQAPSWALSRQTGPDPVLSGGSGPGSQDANGDIQELPRRVRQASLAPQLRADPPRRPGTRAGGGPSSGPTPAEIRRTVSALQHGWQEGRSRHGSPSEPLPGPGFSPSAGGGHDSTADEQAGGEADGT
jgi:signal transduction histidine kinase